MSDKIRLSEKHGLNPSLCLCFICGNDNGAIAIPGRLPLDEKAPYKAVWDYHPCDQCKGYMQQGIIFFTDKPDGTRRIAVLKEEAVKRVIPEPMLAQVLKKRCAGVEWAAWEKLKLPVEDYPPAV